MKQKIYIFIGVFAYGFLVQQWGIGPSDTPDKFMWADQIKYFLANDPRMFDFYAAYGHPGTTLVGLGSLLHLSLGVSYVQALILSKSLLVASATAICAVMCAWLYPHSLWWVATTFTLLLSRLHIVSTPPTAVVLPFLVLIVLSTWSLCDLKSTKKNRAYILWGVAVGLSAATRTDATLLVGLPMFLILWWHAGCGILLPALSGALLSFFLADPFLWFMPFQHLTDLVHKFSVHYKEFMFPTKIHQEEWAHAIPLALLCICWALFHLARRRLPHVPPHKILLALLGITLLSTVVILSSSYQSIRYFYPVVIIWEVLLPLFALETFVYVRPQKIPGGHCLVMVPQWVIIGVVVIVQLLAYLVRWL